MFQILEMHRAMHHAFGKLGPDSGINPEEIKFAGFDGNDETDHFRFAIFLSSEGKFDDLTKADVEKILAARIHPDFKK